MHELMKYDNEEIISNIRHKKILPLGKRISEGIIFNLSLQKVMLKEKKYEMLNGDRIYYLTERFLRSIAQTEAKRKYQILSRTIKTINKKYPEDGLEYQMDTKSKLCKIFEEDQEFSINKIGDELFGKNPQKKMEFDEKMERYNMQYDKFTVEKEETIKDLGYIKLQTNNEIEIKIPMEEYQTKECIKVEEEQKRTCGICGKTETRTIGDKLNATISMNATSLKLKKKQTTKKFTVTGLAKSDYITSWTSSNKKIVTVTGNQNGTCKIKAGNKTGKAKITITLASGLKKTINVTIQKKAVICTAIKNVSKKLTLNKKKSYQLKPVINPITCTNKIKYKSSNKKIAKVSSNGKITAIKPGKVKITISVGKKKFVSNVIIKK